MSQKTIEQLNKGEYNPKFIKKVLSSSLTGAAGKFKNKKDFLKELQK